MESAASDVTTFSRGIRGTVRMAAPASVGRALYVRAAQEFRAEYPQVQLEFSERPTGDVLQRLSIEHLDLGIVSKPGTHEHLVFTPLMRDETVLLCPPGTPPTARGYVDPADLKALPIIIPSGLRRIFQERFSAHFASVPYSRTVAPFHIPLGEPDVRISRIRLSCDASSHRIRAVPCRR